ncbi:MAG: hypothetical protein ABI830_07815 [Pseudolabrys sp.]
MTRLVPLVPLATVTLLAAFDPGAGSAEAARALVNDLLIRPPAAAGKLAMDRAALEACLVRARDLDIVGVEVDGEVDDADHLAAEGLILQNRINAELPMVGGFDENRLKAFEARLRRRKELATKFEADFPVYQKHQQAYNDGVAAFERDCSNGFSANDLEAARARLGIK